MPLGPITFTAVNQGNNVALSVLATDLTKIVSITRGGVVVRGTNDALAPGEAFRGNDYEAPNNVPITYVVTAEGDSVNDRDTATATLDGVIDYGGDYLMPVGFPSLGVVVQVEYGGVGTLDYNVLRDVVPVLNRRDPVVISYGRSMWAGTFTFLTLTDGEREALLVAMQSPVIMFAPRPGFGFKEPVFLSPGVVSENRTVGLGSEQSRRFSIPFIQVQRPPADYGSALPSNDWQSKIDSGDTWQDALDSNLIWFDYAGFR